MIFKITLTTKAEKLTNGQKVVLHKEPNNPYDDEAIAVIINGERDGYVLAHYKTRRVGTISAGRLLDKIKETEEAIVTDAASQIAEVEGK